MHAKGCVRVETANVLSHKLDYFESVLNGTASCLDHNIISLFLLKLSFAVAYIAVEVEKLVGNADFPALVSTHLWGVYPILDVEVTGPWDLVLAYLTHFGSESHRCVNLRLAVHLMSEFSSRFEKSGCYLLLDVCSFLRLR